MSPSYAAIRAAILNKQQVLGNYQGYYRELCPHTLGLKNGREQALFIQFGGESSSGLSDDPTRNWRCIPLADFELIEVRDGEWHTASNHSRPQTCVDDVDVEATS